MGGTALQHRRSCATLVVDDGKDPSVDVSEVEFVESPVTATPRAVELALVAAQAAADKVAKDIVILDVSDRLVITDCFVICSAPNERQVAAGVEEGGRRMRRGEGARGGGGGGGGGGGRAKKSRSAGKVTARRAGSCSTSSTSSCTCSTT